MAGIIRMAKWTQQIQITQVDTRSFRIAAENKLHLPEMWDLGAPLFWNFGVRAWECWGWSGII